MRKTSKEKNSAPVIESGQVARPQQRNGIFLQPENVKPVLSAWDEMVVAKNFPG